MSIPKSKNQDTKGNILPDSNTSMKNQKLEKRIVGIKYQHITELLNQSKNGYNNGLIENAQNELDDIILNEDCCSCLVCRERRKY